METGSPTPQKCACPAVMMTAGQGRKCNSGTIRNKNARCFAPPRCFVRGASSAGQGVCIALAEPACTGRRVTRFGSLCLGKLVSRKIALGLSNFKLGA